MIGVDVLDEVFIKNGLIVAFLTVGLMLFLADWISKIFNKQKHIKIESEVEQNMSLIH